MTALFVLKVSAISPAISSRKIIARPPFAWTDAAEYRVSAQEITPEERSVQGVRGGATGGRSAVYPERNITRSGGLAVRARQRPDGPQARDRAVAHLECSSAMTLNG